MEDIQEVWRFIEGCEGIYQISNLGRVKRQGKIMPTQITASGYYRARLSVNGKKMCPMIHKLVANAFIPNPHNCKQIRFKDGNKTNIVYTNLYWHKVEKTESAILEKPRRHKIITDTGEIWIDIKGYEEIYQVSNLGRVRSLDKIVRATRYRTISETEKYPFRVFTNRRERILQQYTSTRGYKFVMLSKDTKKKRAYIASLVADAFIINPHNCKQVRHKDGDKTNNIYTNLFWYAGKTILKIDIGGRVIKRYFNIDEAAEEEHYCTHTIRRAIKSKRLLEGFIYKFK